MVKGVIHDLENFTTGSTRYYFEYFGGKDYYTDSSQVQYDGENFIMALIRIDVGHTTDYNFSTNEQYHNVGHEFGHALSLGHFFSSDPYHSSNHWMRQGQISLISPTSTDTSHLQYKWGY